MLQSRAPVAEGKEAQGVSVLPDAVEAHAQAAFWAAAAQGRMNVLEVLLADPRVDALPLAQERFATALSAAAPPGGALNPAVAGAAAATNATVAVQPSVQRFLLRQPVVLQRFTFQSAAGALLQRNTQAVCC